MGLGLPHGGILKGGVPPLRRCAAWFCCFFVPGYNGSAVRFTGWRGHPEASVCCAAGRSTIMKATRARRTATTTTRTTVTTTTGFVWGWVWRRLISLRVRGSARNVARLLAWRPRQRVLHVQNTREKARDVPGRSRAFWRGSGEYRTAPAPGFVPGPGRCFRRGVRAARSCRSASSNRA